MSIACSVSTFRGTLSRARESSRRDSAKRLVTRVSNDEEKGRCREAIRHVAVNNSGEC